MSKYGVFSGPYFSVFGLNTEIYFIIWRVILLRKVLITPLDSDNNFSYNAIKVVPSIEKSSEKKKDGATNTLQNEKLVEDAP